MQQKSKFVLAAIILLSVFLVVYIGYSVFMQPVEVNNQSINQSREILSVVDLPQAEFQLSSVDQPSKSTSQLEIQCNSISLQDFHNCYGLLRA
jgi:flagellar basal body-associated protein FliL